MPSLISQAGEAQTAKVPIYNSLWVKMLEKVIRSKELSCSADRQEVCSNPSVQVKHSRGPTLALELMVDIIRSL